MPERVFLDTNILLYAKIDDASIVSTLKMWVPTGRIRKPQSRRGQISKENRGYKVINPMRI
jgi:hypothetical protein